MSEIRVLLIEDHIMIRIALRSVLEATARIRIVGECSDGLEGMKLYRFLRPDVIVVDLRLPGISVDVITALRNEHRSARIVVLSNYNGSEHIHRALRAGAMSYLTKDASGQELVNAIQSVHNNVRFLPRRVLDCVTQQPPMKLTAREEEVLHSIAQGMRTREIADQLRICEQTVRDHVSSVLNKMGARDRTQAVVYALRCGLIHVDWQTE